MYKKEYPILCGGTFLTLLLEAAKQGLSGRRKALGYNDGFSETDVFVALLQIVVSTYKRPHDCDNFRPIVSA